MYSLQPVRLLLVSLLSTLVGFLDSSLEGEGLNSKFRTTWRVVTLGDDAIGTERYHSKQRHGTIFGSLKPPFADSAMDPWKM